MATDELREVLEGEGPYEVIASSARGDVPVRKCGTMTEAVIWQLRLEELVANAGVTCPSLRVEMRGAQ